MSRVGSAASASETEGLSPAVRRHDRIIHGFLRHPLRDDKFAISEAREVLQWKLAPRIIIKRFSAA